MNKALKAISSLCLLFTIFCGVAKAQTAEPFTYSGNGSSFFNCIQNTEKEGCKIGFTLENDAAFFCLDLNLNNAYKTDAVGEFPEAEETLVAIGLIFENQTSFIAYAVGIRFGQIIKIKSRITQFKDLNDTEVEVETVLETMILNSIDQIIIGWDKNKLFWKLNSFKTAPTIHAMSQKIGQEQANQSGSNPGSNGGGNKPSKEAWRTQLRKVVDHPTHNYKGSGSKYKGQVALTDGVERRQGLGLIWYPSDYIYIGGFINGDLMGYAIDIASVGNVVNYCPNCAYYVGYYCDGFKCGKGKCYDSAGNLIYYGDFSSDQPTGTYPSTQKYSSNRFECIEYTDGDKYVGETYNGKRHGQGIYLWANGDAWYGSWKDGIRDGFGIMLYYNGNVKYGKWSDNTCDKQ